MASHRILTHHDIAEIHTRGYLQDVTGDVMHEQVADLFVNNNDIPVTLWHDGDPREIELITEDMERVCQAWERLLFGPEGKSNLTKCLWWLLAFVWVDGKARPAKRTEVLGNIALTLGRGTQKMMIRRFKLNESADAQGMDEFPRWDGGQVRQATWSESHVG